jgi:hypothetical protein
LNCSTQRTMHKFYRYIRICGLVRISVLIIISSCFFSCRELIKTDPEIVSDTSEVVITCDSRLGNKGLLDYTGDVYVHVGLITSKSLNSEDWRYVKFTWGSRDNNAKATPVGKNRWSYSIKNVREYFKVPGDEKIINLAILYRSGACIDIHCKTLRNIDGSNIYIPIKDQSAVLPDLGTEAE